MILDVWIIIILFLLVKTATLIVLPLTYIVTLTNAFIISVESFTTTRTVSFKHKLYASIRRVDIERYFTVFRAKFPDRFLIRWTSNVNFDEVIMARRHVTLDIKGTPWKLRSIAKGDFNIILAIKVIGIISITIRWLHCSAITGKRGLQATRS